MNAVHGVVVIAHLLGVVALLVGGIGALVRPTGIFPTILLWAARVQVLTGLVLAALAIFGADDDDPANAPKLAVKAVVALGVAGLAESGVRRKARPLIIGAVVLTLVNAAIASMWH